ncbi:MAG: alpha/beta hydrolase [Candidatus Hinthialibacter sp.]
MFKTRAIWILALILATPGILFAQQENAADASQSALEAVEEKVTEAVDAAAEVAEEVVETVEQAVESSGIPANTRIPLWPEDVPSKKSSDEKDWPTLTLYLLPKTQSARPAVVICPGGGYGHLAMDHEGHQVARWFNSFGVSAIILEYRHAPLYRDPVPMMDAMRAMRTTRARAEEWGIDPDRIGVMGFSAGGHLASTVGTHFDMGNPTSSDPIEKIKSRPDFMILMYPVITFFSDYTHMGSRNNLLGEEAEANLISYYSNETQIQPSTPPTFIVHSYDDKVVPVENSLKFIQGLRYQSITTEAHIFQYGGHGYGLAPNDPTLNRWTKCCEDWMRHLGLLK